MLSQAQQKAIEHIRDRGIVWMKMGCGKSRVGLFWSQRFLAGESKALIICRNAAIDDWIVEIQKCGLPREQYHIYPYSQLSQVVRLRYACCIVDELFLCKNNKTQRSNKVKWITKKIPTIGLSGTIVSQGNILDMFGQLSAINAEKETYSAFRHRTFNRIKRFGYWDFTVKRKALRETIKKYEDCIFIHYPKTRPWNDIIIDVELTQEQIARLQFLKENWAIQLKGKELDLNYALQINTKIQQISCGFIKHENEIERFTSSKLNKLLQKINDILDENPQLLIWTCFREDVERITENLEGVGIPSLKFVGGQPFEIDRWRSGECRVTVGTVANGSSVNHFKDVPCAIFYSQPYSARDVAQAKARTDRKDSKHTECLYLHLHSNQTTDRDIYNISKKAGDFELDLIRRTKEWIEKV